MSNDRVFGVIPSDRLTRRGILRTLFMPEIKLSFGSMGMTHRAFLAVIASMFIQAGLLPYNHPAQNMNTMGRYGFREIVGEAWYNMRHNGKGDVHQWGLFMALFLLFGLAILSIIMIITQFMISTAQAAIFSLSPERAERDLGLLLIDMIIGDAASGETSNPLQGAIGSVLQHYSYGILVIASFIVAWSILSIVVDTAATGRFFGGRHNPVWWPIRLVFALGILIPISNGFNAGQLMVIQIAKWGSNFASNAWTYYVEKVVIETANPSYYFVKQLPSYSPVGQIGELSLVYLCMEIQNAYLTSSGKDSSSREWVHAFPAVSRENSKGINEIIYNVGTEVYPSACGSITFYKNNSGTIHGTIGEYAHFRDLVRVIGEVSGGSERIREAINASYTQVYMDLAKSIASEFVPIYNSADQTYDQPLSDDLVERTKQAFDAYYLAVRNAIESAKTDFSSSFPTALNVLTEMGWASAPLWYYILGTANEEYSKSIDEAPQINLPESLLIKRSSPSYGLGFKDGGQYYTRVEEARRRDQQNLQESIRYHQGFNRWWWQNLQQYKNTPIESPPPGTQLSLEDEIRAAFDMGLKHGSLHEEEKTSGEKLLDAIRPDFIIKELESYLSRLKSKGLEKGFSREGVHPIVLMAEVGRDLLAVVSLIIVIPLIVGAIPLIGSGVAMIAGLLAFIVSPAIVAGIFLAVILPMMPLIRTVFAVSSWMIALLEAIVMVPIIALGHLRTDGEGILGPSLQGAYLMLLQLLLRPILILLGLILSMMLVEATIGYVNSIYWVMVDRVPTGGQWNILYQIIRFVGYNVMYFVLMFILINSSFKIVDLFPEAVIKFLGGGASGGLQDREDGSLNTAVIASAVYARGYSPVNMAGARGAVGTGLGKIAGALKKDKKPSAEEGGGKGQGSTANNTPTDTGGGGKKE